MIEMISLLLNSVIGHTYYDYSSYNIRFMLKRKDLWGFHSLLRDNKLLSYYFRKRIEIYV